MLIALRATVTMPAHFQLACCSSLGRGEGGFAGAQGEGGGGRVGWEGLLQSRQGSRGPLHGPRADKCAAPDPTLPPPTAVADDIQKKKDDIQGYGCLTKSTATPHHHTGSADDIQRYGCLKSCGRWPRPGRRRRRRRRSSTGWREAAEVATRHRDARHAYRVRTDLKCLSLLFAPVRIYIMVQGVCLG